MRSQRDARARGCWLLSLVAAAGRRSRRSPSSTIGGTTYTKWLWGNAALRRQRSTTSPRCPARATATTARARRSSCCCNAKLSKYVEVTGAHPQPLQPEPVDELRRLRRPQSGLEEPPGATASAATAASSIRARTSTSSCAASTVTLTPGYSWLDSATIGASDWGMFDPFVDRPRSATSTATTRRASSSRARRSTGRCTLGRRPASRCRASGPARTSTPATTPRPTPPTALQIKYAGRARASTSRGIVEYVNDIEVDADRQQLRRRPRDPRSASRTRLGAQARRPPERSCSTSAAAYYYSDAESATGARRAGRASRHRPASRRSSPASTTDRPGRSNARPQRPVRRRPRPSTSRCFDIGARLRRR